MEKITENKKRTKLAMKKKDSKRFLEKTNKILKSNNIGMKSNK